jgi:hypothetical protein
MSSSKGNSFGRIRQASHVRLRLADRTNMTKLSPLGGKPRLHDGLPYQHSYCVKHQNALLSHETAPSFRGTAEHSLLQRLRLSDPQPINGRTHGGANRQANCCKT